MNRPLCRHCGNEVVTRPKGLGWKCYYTPGVKEMYGCANPATAKYAVRSEVLDFFREAPLPAVATDARPGTEDKIAVMERRAQRLETLFHPLDGRLGDDRPVWVPPADDTDEEDD